MKLNNKGFTLVELIATIAIITLLTVIVAPSVISSLNSGKNKSYEILVENIYIASQELYEEVYSNELLGVTSNLYHYNSEGTKTENKIEINDNSITVNLQTLVANGFLSGSNKKTDNGTIKVITNPKADEKNEIGACQIMITRNSNNGKVTYEVTAQNTLKDSNNKNVCPTTEDYKKGVK